MGRGLNPCLCSNLSHCSQILNSLCHNGNSTLHFLYSVIIEGASTGLLVEDNFISEWPLLSFLRFFFFFFFFFFPVMWQFLPRRACLSGPLILISCCHLLPRLSLVLMTSSYSLSWFHQTDPGDSSPAPGRGTALLMSRVPSSCLHGFPGARNQTCPLETGSFTTAVCQIYQQFLWLLVLRLPLVESFWKNGMLDGALIL